MKRQTLGAIFLIIIGASIIGLYTYAKPYLAERSMRKTSNARKTETLIVCADDYLGYWFVTAPETTAQLAQNGIVVEFHNDGGAYADRLDRFNAKKCDALLLPINSYLQHGMPYTTGTIDAGISRSLGADGIVGFPDRFASGQINDLNDPSLRIVYVAESPSEFLLDLMIADFGLDRLRATDSWRVPVKDQEEVVRLALIGKGDAFVLWEPNISKILDKKPELKLLWGSNEFPNYINDVFVFRRDIPQNRVSQFFTGYFTAMQMYASDRDRMIKEMTSSSGIKRDVVTRMLDRIDWLDLFENLTLQFGIETRVGDSTRQDMIQTILSCKQVLELTHRLPSNTVRDPYILINSGILEALGKEIATRPVGANIKSHDFPKLDDAEWSRLQTFGAFRMSNITFQTWNSQLTPQGKDAVDEIARLLTHNYPHVRVRIRGHTATGGDETENMQLSQERADVVMRYITLAYPDIDTNRLRADGRGSSEANTLPRLPNENSRRYLSRLNRVEFIAYVDKL